MEFTYNDYQNMIVQINSSGGGYCICNYHNYNSTKNPCILRHDVDLDLEKAADFAKLEAELEVQATYFILVNTNFYNVFSAQNRKWMERILFYGHEIGLHFDEMQYKIQGNWKMLQEKVIEEAKVLSEILGTPVTTVSMHRPSVGLLEAEIEIPGMINSYQHTFFRKFKYYSDSRMFWREDVLKGINPEKNKALHILTHPFWYSEKPENIKEKIVGFVRAASVQRYNWLDLNFRDLEEVAAREEVFLVRK